MVEIKPADNKRIEFECKGLSELRAVWYSGNPELSAFRCKDTPKQSKNKKFTRNRSLQDEKLKQGIKSVLKQNYNFQCHRLLKLIAVL